MKKPKIKEDKGGSYFTREPDLEFIPSGSALLDCILGGGYAIGRIVNIIGDKSTGKTLLAIEAAANFINKYPTGKIWYNEVEAAFDKSYAEMLGLPIKQVQFTRDHKECFTVEELFSDLEEAIDKLKDEYGLYILDSLDALSDKVELNTGFDEKTFGINKPKLLGKLFRQLVQKIEYKKLTIIIISQTRDKISPMVFGRKTTRSGGRALDFYSSQTLYLAHKATLMQTRKKIKRPIGVQIKVKCDKNKVGLPFRECEFPIKFGFGVDDIGANISWLSDIGRLKELPIEHENEKQLIEIIKEMNDQEYRQASGVIAEKTKEIWREIDIDFLPTRTKYGLDWS